MPIKRHVLEQHLAALRQVANGRLEVIGITTAITGPRQVIGNLNTPGLAAPVHCIVMPCLQTARAVEGWDVRTVVRQPNRIRHRVENANWAHGFRTVHVTPDYRGAKHAVQARKWCGTPPGSKTGNGGGRPLALASTGMANKEQELARPMIRVSRSECTDFPRLTTARVRWGMPTPTLIRSIRFGFRRQPRDNQRKSQRARWRMSIKRHVLEQQLAALRQVANGRLEVIGITTAVTRRRPVTVDFKIRPIRRSGSPLC